VAKQIIEALEYAHDRGVVHRDLKPANVTLMMGHTRAGVILGTAAYMSPEQAVGRPADRRSDIFSFGAVLFEMLTGKRAFAGATTPDVLEAVVKNDPDWSTLPAGVPRHLRRLLERCLAKDRKQRLQAIGEARIMLENPNAISEIILFNFQTPTITDIGICSACTNLLSGVTIFASATEDERSIGVGDVLRWNYGTAAINTSLASKVLAVKTNAKSFQTGTIGTIDGGTTTTAGFAPIAPTAVPEPTSAVPVLLFAAGLFAARRFKVA